MDVVVFPVLVQGAGAAADIASMLDLINENFDDLDTLIVGRGGGSAEDLWPFNEEIVARAIYRCDIPIISAVGHEIDFTIADFAADKRAETPTAAAEMAVPDTAELLKKIEIYKNNLTVQMNNKIKYDKLRADNCILDMKNVLNRMIASMEHKMETLKLYLDENNPSAVLGKGYSILQDADGKSVSSVSQISLSEDYSLILKDGRVKVKALEIEGGSEHEF